jgi:hypothetical protein
LEAANVHLSVIALCLLRLPLLHQERLLVGGKG